ncbi:MAG: hypothetical protein K0Q90_1994 [Paenibacillaceae bacterium]|jgi:Flp pilus assembly CpaE family ATPase|nr:hypothetical protein [Paenibacillaceae bacterium]
MTAQGQLIVFTGSTPNIGATVLSFGTAALLAKLSGDPVAYLCLNLKSSKLHHYLGLEPSPPGLDQIRAEMRSCSLTPGFLKSRMEQIKGAPGVHVLFGSLQREQAEFFQPEDISHLLDTAKQCFPRCVVEVNAYWDNAATLAALIQADERVLVTSLELGHFQEDVNRGLKQMAPLFGIDPGQFLLAVAQQGRTDPLTPQDAAKETGMRLAAVVKADPELRRLLGQGRLAEYINGNEGFVQSILPLCGEWGVLPEEPAAGEGFWTVLGRQCRLLLGGRQARRNQ